MITDAVLEQYIVLKETEKAVKAELERIKEMLIAAGSFNTDYYVVAVLEQERRGVRPLNDIIKIFGIELVQEYDLISVSSFKKVVVSKK